MNAADRASGDEPVRPDAAAAPDVAAEPGASTTAATSSSGPRAASTASPSVASPPTTRPSTSSRSPAPRKPRTRMSPEQRRSQLVERGLAWLAQRPLDAITVEDLAADTNVSPGLVFYYFESRQGLHKAILEAAGALFLAAFEPSLNLPAHERVHDAIARTVAFVREHGETFASIARSATSPDVEIRAINTAVRDQSARYTRAMLDELGLPDTPIVDLSIHAWLVVVEQTLLAAVPRTGADLPDDEIVNFLTRTLFAMIDIPTEGEKG